MQGSSKSSQGRGSSPCEVPWFKLLDPVSSSSGASPPFSSKSLLGKTREVLAHLRGPSDKLASHTGAGGTTHAPSPEAVGASVPSYRCCSQRRVWVGLLAEHFGTREVGAGTCGSILGSSMCYVG